jgi:hypothetical protein
MVVSPLISNFAFIGEVFPIAVLPSLLVYQRMLPEPSARTRVLFNTVDKVVMFDPIIVLKLPVCNPVSLGVPYGIEPRKVLNDPDKNP